MSIIAKLEELRRNAGKVRTQGLPDATIERMAAQFPELAEAVDDALVAQRALAAEFPDLMKLDEATQLARVQADFVNFYA
ncbi:MAG TPA: lysine 6-aminotransferase, partial [Rudaea sp.]|nr:lysine 6-aminotransferase [Rudaea sp.]